MHLTHRRSGLATTVLLALGIGALLRAGEPIPDIDVILEQNPGGVIAVLVRPPLDNARVPVSDVDVLLQKVPSGLAFDGVRLSGDRALRDLEIDDLPPGWGLRREGRRLELSGPAVVPPVRFRLALGAKPPAKLDVELLADGEVGHARRNVVPREVPARRVAGTLEGTVRLPPRVSPGETIALRALPDANLPPGGAWVISGTVSDPSDSTSASSEPWTDEELTATQRTILNAARNIRLQAALPPLTLTGSGDCDSLAPTAAALLARDNFNTSKSSTIDWLTDPHDEPMAVSFRAPVPGTAPHIVTAPLAPRAASYHILSRGKIGAGLRSSYAFALADGTDESLRTGFAIKEEDMPVETSAAISIKEKGVQRVVIHGSPSGANPPDAQAEIAEITELSVRTVDAAQLAEIVEIAETLIVVAALDAEPVAGGCRYTSREPTELEQWRFARARTAKTLGQKFGTVAKGAAAASVAHLLTLPRNLQPGEPLSIRYLDEWGDPWVDVADVPDVEVVDAEASEPRRLDSAGRYVVAGRTVCVCGGFDALDIATPFRLGEHTVQATSVGRTSVWLTAPAEALGPQVIQAEGFRGEAATDVIQIAAELDQEHLFSGQRTPLRLTVSGSEQSIPIQLVNRSPQIITLEGGDEQNLETPGGPDNTVVRQVSAQQRGSFQMFWEVPPAPCPCTEDR